MSPKSIYSHLSGLVTRRQTRTSHCSDPAHAQRRVEQERGRRSELKEAHSALKESLHASNQSLTKLKLIRLATAHITAIETTQEELRVKLQEAEKKIEQLNL